MPSHKCCLMVASSSTTAICRTQRSTGSSEETGSREAASSRTQTEDKPRTERPRVLSVDVRRLLSGHRTETGQSCSDTPQNQSTRTISIQTQTPDQETPNRISGVSRRLMPPQRLRGECSCGNAQMSWQTARSGLGDVEHAHVVGGKR